MFKAEPIKMSVRSNVYGFTVNTRKAVNMGFLEKLVKYLKKCPGGMCVREKPGSEKEHLHGIIIYDEVRHKDSVAKQFKRMMECIPSEDYDFQKAVCLKCVYSDDWQTKYLQKAEDTITEYDKIIPVEYVNMIEKKTTENREPPLGMRILSVCQQERYTSFVDIRECVIKYLVENGVPPPRFDVITSMCKSLFCYMNYDNYAVLSKLPVPEGFDREYTGEALKSLKMGNILYPELDKRK